MNKDIKEKFELAKEYYYGIKIEQNYKASYEIFSELVEKFNYRYAKYYIAKMYFWGVYVKQDYEKAYDIFNELVLEYNDKNSKTFIKRIYYLNNYLKKDFSYDAVIQVDLEKFHKKIYLGYYVPYKEYDEDMILEFRNILKSDFDDFYYRILPSIKNYELKIKNENNPDMFFFVKPTKEIYQELNIDKKNTNYIKLEHDADVSMYEVFDVLDKNIDYNYLINIRFYIGNTSKNSIWYIDDLMRLIKQEYSIIEYENNHEIPIIEYTFEDIINSEQNKPLHIYLNKYKKKNDNNDILIKIKDINSKVMIYISNMISILYNNNDAKYIDFIAITSKKSAYNDVWKFLNENNIEYINKYAIEIDKNEQMNEKILNQIMEFFKNFKIKYYVEENVFSLILTFYPTNEEEVDFIIDVLKINKISFIEYLFSSNIDYSQTSLWIFQTSKNEKEKICELFEKNDENQIIEVEDLYNYGIITNKKMQNQIENILQSLKLNYSILDSKQIVNEL